MNSLVMNKDMSKSMNLLRFPLALAVVYLHCSGTINTIPYKDGFDTQFVDLLRIAISHVITHLAVPSFFLISGYLYFKEGVLTKSLWITKQKKRLFTLLIPYLLWNMIPLLYILAKRIGAACINGAWENVGRYWASIDWIHLFWDLEPLNETSQNLFEVLTPLAGPINFPLWYLRDLILLTMLSPLIYLLIKRGKIYFPIFLFVCFLSGIWFTHRILPIIGIFFFSFGGYFSINKIDFLNEKIVKSFVLKLFTVFTLGVAIFYDGMNTYIGTIAYKLFILAGVCMIFHIAHVAVKKGISIKKWLVDASFLIYVSHFVFVFLINIHVMALERFLNDACQLLLIVDYLLYPLLITACCLLTGWILHKLFPVFYRFLIGSR